MSHIQDCANKNFYLEDDKIVFVNTATLGLSHPNNRSEIRQYAAGEWDTASSTKHINEGELMISRWDQNVQQITLAQVHHLNYPGEEKVGPLLRVAAIRDRGSVHNHLWAIIKDVVATDSTSTNIDLGAIPVGYFRIKIEAGNSKLSVWIDNEQKVINRDIYYWDGQETYFKNGAYFPYESNINAQVEVYYKNISWTKIIRADVDQNGTINSTDAMLILRNSLGLSMAGTDWEISETTGDVNCDGISNSTDAMLILRYSLGLDISGTGWCG